MGMQARGGGSDEGDEGRPYTIILPARHPAPHLRGALDGLRALRPPPDEIIIGLDSDDRVLGGRIPDWPSITVLRIPPSERYGMPLAHVLIECARAARNDRLLFTNADIRLEQRTMDGLPMIGPPGRVAWVSHSERWPVRSPGDWLRWRHYQKQLRAVENPMTGNYWIWRPYMFDAVPQRDFESINDGIDTLIYKRLGAAGYGIRGFRESGSRLLGRSHGYLPWVAFKDGLKAAVPWARSLDGLLATGTSAKTRRLPGRLRVPAAKAYLMLPTAGAVLRAASTWRPEYARGFVWALLNRDSGPVRAAGEADDLEWIFSGSRHVRECPVRGGGAGWRLDDGQSGTVSLF